LLDIKEVAQKLQINLGKLFEMELV
jgi:hypothetical protein